ncbi:Asp23/Gls24 family envelope stress response protein [Streptomyces rochei]|uniref:Asp23/Gls24 family envelope stress response protein n=1 Tax=Streptomyces rochei TaxID=1928 RepID=A0ABW7ECH9_STRRO
MAMNTGADRPEPGTGPADGTAHDDELLACGRTLSQAWAAWEDDINDPHLSDCPHCAQAVQQLTLLGEAVLGTRDENETDWDTTGLTERVMEVVRLELRPGRPLPLGTQDEDLWVREAMVAKTLRAAAETVSGVHAGSCRVRPTTQDVTGCERGPVRVRLEVVVPFTADLQNLADEIRSRVSTAADAALGLPVENVNIHIADVTEPASDAPDPGVPVPDDSSARDGIRTLPGRRAPDALSRRSNEETHEGDQP